MVLINLDFTGTVYIRGATQLSRDEAVESFVRKFACLLGGSIDGATNLIG